MGYGQIANIDMDDLPDCELVLTVIILKPCGAEDSCGTSGRN